MGRIAPTTNPASLRNPASSRYARGESVFGSAIGLGSEAASVGSKWESVVNRIASNIELVTADVDVARAGGVDVRGAEMMPAIFRAARPPAAARSRGAR
jgi:hypothetical protein